MSSKRNQTIAIARFLMYKYGLNQQLEGMTDEEYLAHPIGLDVGQYCTVYCDPLAVLKCEYENAIPSGGEQHGRDHSNTNF